ncbi:MAG: transcriptional repressor LexA [Planctomycetota bacterium]|jgi:repressor LexA|nr:transcriptional repressor LexA [Planctomycetota bacterium]
MRDLTGRQQEIFNFILAALREEGVIPSVREICQAFGFASTNAVNSHLDALAKKGYINRRPGAARNIEVAPDFLQPERGVPIVGRVAAGNPIDAIENLEGYLDLDVIYAQPEHFALRVAGDSMVDAGLWDGDFVIVRRQPRVESGEIGVAVIDGQATIKRFHWLAGGGLELVPENEKYQPFTVDPAADFSIGGKVVGMHRILR